MRKTTQQLLTLLMLMPALAWAQVTLPPSGDNHKSSVSQWIGLVKVTVDYSSPNVTDPGGNDRRGKIWGGVVPYGMSPNNSGYGTAKEMPWRAGANENTTFTVSHDVMIQGEALAAGTYGFHVIPQETGEWTIIFSNNSSAWGSYFYKPSEDALRVTASPKKDGYAEWLNYTFIDREAKKATCVLEWEEIKLPFTISVPNSEDLYLQAIRNDISIGTGYSADGFVNAVNYCLQINKNLEEAAVWANMAVNDPFVGRKSFKTMEVQAKVLYKLGKKDEASKLMEEAFKQPTANVMSVHAHGRWLIGEGMNKEALAVFEMNRKNNPEAVFVTSVGLGRGYAAVGEHKKAAAYFTEAAAKAPQGQADYYKGLAEKAAKGEQVN